VVAVGVLTPHAAIGPEEELPLMAPGRVLTNVARVADPPPTSARDLRALMRSGALDEAAEQLTIEPVDAIALASTSAAYATGVDEERATLSRLEERAGVPVVPTCASAVLPFRLLGGERIALVHPPWFSDELNRLGAAYFQSLGLNVVMSASADLPSDPNRIEPDDVLEWAAQNVEPCGGLRRHGQQLEMRMRACQLAPERRQRLEARAPVVTHAQTRKLAGSDAASASTAASASASVRRAPASNDSPASVSVTSRLVRANRLTPSSCSRCRIATLSGGCAIRNRRAARLKLSSSATATK
jgi:maleate isomerase